MARLSRQWISAATISRSAFIPRRVMSRRGWCPSQAPRSFIPLRLSHIHLLVAGSVFVPGEAGNEWRKGGGPRSRSRKGAGVSTSHGRINQGRKRKTAKVRHRRRSFAGPGYGLPGADDVLQVGREELGVRFPGGRSVTFTGFANADTGGDIQRSSSRILALTFVFSRTQHFNQIHSCRIGGDVSSFPKTLVLAGPGRLLIG